MDCELGGTTGTDALLIPLTFNKANCASSGRSVCDANSWAATLAFETACRRD